MVTGASWTEATNAFKLIVTIILLNESIKGLSVALYIGYSLSPETYWFAALTINSMHVEICLALLYK